MDGKGRLNVLSKLTIIADLSEEASPAVNLWLTNNPFPDRLVLVNKAQDDTALLLPDIAITGPLNMRYGKEFVCDVTTIPSEVSDLWSVYPKLAKKRTGRVSRREVRLTIDMARVMMHNRSDLARSKRLLSAVLSHAVALESIDLEQEIISLIEQIDANEAHEPMWRTFLDKLQQSAKLIRKKKSNVAPDATPEATPEAAPNTAPEEE